MNRPKVKAQLFILFGCLILSFLGYILYFVSSYVIVYSFSLSLALTLSLIVFLYAMNFILHGALKLKDLQGKLKGKPEKKYFLYLSGLYLITLPFLIYFLVLFSSVDFYANHDASGNGVTNLLLAFFYGSTSLFLFSAFKSLSYFLAIQKNKTTPERDYTQFKRIQGVGFILILLGAGVIALLTHFIAPDGYWGIMGFSDPAYDLPSSPHYNSLLDNDSLVDQEILECLEKGLWALTTLRQQGGFPMWVETDGSHFYSDRGFEYPLFPGEFSLQEGTALLAGLFLEMYQIEPNPDYLEVAEDAAEALIAVQDKQNGGFYYDGRRYENGEGYQPHPKNWKRSTILDDDVTQSCLDFLLEIYNLTKKEKYRDAFEKGFECLQSLEKPQGGWPQRSNYGEGIYFSYVTLNDETLKDVVFLLLKAHTIFPSEPEYLKAAQRACEFLIEVQGNGGSKDQQGWAQQYDDSNQPAWARDFEPSGICSRTTKDAMECLLEMFLVTNETKWLAPIPDALEWLEDSKIKYEVDGEIKEGWARVYELKTNKPIYGMDMGRGKPIPYVYDIELVTHTGYGWQDDFGISAFMGRYELLDSLTYNITAFINAENNALTLSSAKDAAEQVIEHQTKDGFWLSEEKIRASNCAASCTTLMKYLKLAIADST